MSGYIFARKVPRNVFLGEFPHAYNFNKDQKQKFWWFDLVIYCDIMILLLFLISNS